MPSSFTGHSLWYLNRIAPACCLRYSGTRAAAPSSSLSNRASSFQGAVGPPHAAAAAAGQALAGAGRPSPTRAATNGAGRGGAGRAHRASGQSWRRGKARGGHPLATKELPQPQVDSEFGLLATCGGVGGGAQGARAQHEGSAQTSGTHPSARPPNHPANHPSQPFNRPSPTWNADRISESSYSMTAPLRNPSDTGSVTRRAPPRSNTLWGGAKRVTGSGWGRRGGGGGGAVGAAAACLVGGARAGGRRGARRCSSRPRAHIRTETVQTRPRRRRARGKARARRAAAGQAPAPPVVRPQGAVESEFVLEARAAAALHLHPQQQLLPGPGLLLQLQQALGVFFWGGGEGRAGLWGPRHARGRAAPGLGRHARGSAAPARTCTALSSIRTPSAAAPAPSLAPAAAVAA